MKYVSTHDEYYNRKTEADFLEEELASREGCRALTLLMLLVVIVSLIVFGWVKIFNQINS